MAQVSIFLLQNIRDWPCCPCGDVPVVTAQLSPLVCCQIQGSWAQLVYWCLLGPNSPTFEVGIEQLWRFPSNTGLHWAQILYTLITNPWYVCIGKETEVIADSHATLQKCSLPPKKAPEPTQTKICMMNPGVFTLAAGNLTCFKKAPKLLRETSFRRGVQLPWRWPPDRWVRSKVLQHVAQHAASSLMVFIYGRNNPRIWGLHGRDKISTDSSQESNRPSASVYYHNVIIYVHRSTVIVTPCKQPPLHPPRVSQIHASVHSEWSKAQIWHVPLEQMAQNA